MSSLMVLCPITESFFAGSHLEMAAKNMQPTGALRTGRDSLCRNINAQAEGMTA